MDKQEDISKDEPEIKEKDLNVNAKEFIPKNKQNKQEKREKQEMKNEDVNDKNTNNANIGAAKFTENLNKDTKDINGHNNQEQDQEDKEEMYEDENEAEFADKMFNEMMMEQGMLDEEEESDDEKWFPKYRNCECCKGFVYKCEGKTCRDLGKCYCKIKSQLDGDVDD